jgi:hypothetical protein
MDGFCGENSLLANRKFFGEMSFFWRTCIVRFGTNKNLVHVKVDARTVIELCSDDMQNICSSDYVPNRKSVRFIKKVRLHTFIYLASLCRAKASKIEKEKNMTINKNKIN